MSEQQLNEMIEVASRVAEKMLRTKGEVRPMWHAIMADGDNLLVPAPHPDKDTAVALIRALFEIKNVVRYVFVDEAWVVIGRGPIPDEVRAWLGEHGARAHPGRIDAVMFTGEDGESGKQISSFRRILRPPQGKARLGPMEHYSAGREQEGRLIGLLPRRGALH